MSRPTDGANADYQLLIEIRAFDIETAPRTEAVVELSAKVLGNNGRVVGTNVFRAAIPTTVSDASAAAAVLNQAFGQVATELVAWTAKIAKT